jgi:hypothetical protein
LLWQLKQTKIGRAEVGKKGTYKEEKAFMAEETKSTRTLRWQYPFSRHNRELCVIGAK